MKWYNETTQTRNTRIQHTSKRGQTRTKWLWSSLLILSLLMLSACGQSNSEGAKIEEGKVNVITSFILYMHLQQLSAVKTQTLLICCQLVLNPMTGRQRARTL